MADERDDGNLEKVRRWFAQRPDDGSEEAANVPAPRHPQNSLMATIDVAAGWLRCRQRELSTTSASIVGSVILNGLLLTQDTTSTDAMTTVFSERHALHHRSGRE